MSESSTYPSYHVFKGLQKPLEFLGMSGRYIKWAAIAAGSAILGFILGYIICGFLVGIIILFVSAGVGVFLIFTKQKKGLHAKHIDKGVFVYAHLRQL